MNIKNKIIKILQFKKESQLVIVLLKKWIKSLFPIKVLSLSDINFFLSILKPVMSSIMSKWRGFKLANERKVVLSLIF